LNIHHQHYSFILPRHGPYQQNRHDDKVSRQRNPFATTTTTAVVVMDGGTLLLLPLLSFGSNHGNEWQCLYVRVLLWLWLCSWWWYF
jgi:hypothetical protein